MKWGVYLIAMQPPQLTARATVVNSIAYAQAAERLGYDDVWVLEHHFTRYGVVGSPLLHAGYILGATKRIKAGTAISVLPLDHPIRLAEQVALLDQLSDGRLLFGVGRGTFTKDFEVFGVDMGKSREMMIEWLDVMIRAWKTGRTSANSEFLKFPEVEIFPDTFTKPHPPIYTVPQSPTSIEWAAQRGYPMMLSHGIEDEVLASQIELYSEIAEANGHDPDAIPHALSILAGTGRNPEAVKSAFREGLTWWGQEFHRATDLFKPTGAKIPSYEYWQRKWEEAVIRGENDTSTRIDKFLKLSPVGSPQECVERLQRTVDITGAKHIVCGFEGMIQRDAVLENMEAWTSDVLPKIKDSTKRFGSG